jgi:hypothetical protein
MSDWRTSPLWDNGEPVGYAFLLWKGNQVGGLMPEFVAQAAAAKLNELRVDKDGKLVP